MPRYFLAKTDPDTYSITNLAKDKQTNWDGVHSHQAVAVIKSWQIGDLVLVYHSQGEARLVGLMEVIGEPQKDEHDPRGISWYAKVKYVKEFSEDHKITLKEIKQTGLFNDFYLVKQGRLSTMACPDNFVLWLQQKGVI